jgi:hypothetical protein
MKTKSSKTARKNHFFFIVGIFLAIICLSSTILVSFVPQSWPGAYIRDQWLIHEVEQHQRADGFFVFNNDEHPQLIAETYLAVITLNGLSAAIPNKDHLQASLTSVEEEAHDALLKNQPLLAPRDIYELLMIHRLAAIPIDNTLLTGYLAQMSDALTTQNQQKFSSSVHDWYYAIQTLIISNRITPQLRKQTEITILAHLTTKSVQVPLLIETALLIDLSTSLHIDLNAATEQNARLLLKQSWTTKGGFQIGQGPDILSTYFAVLLAHEIGSEDLIQPNAIQNWLTTQRNWDGYSADTATQYLATGYAVVLRNVLNGESSASAPR